MNRDEIIAIVSTVIAEHMVDAKQELSEHVERAVAAKPLPPFVPPPVWTEGRHGATPRASRGGTTPGCQCWSAWPGSTCAGKASAPWRCAPC